MPEITLTHWYLALGILLLALRFVLPSRPNLQKVEKLIFAASIVTLALSIVAIIITFYRYK